MVDVTEFKTTCPICKKNEARLINYKYKLYCIDCYTKEIIKELDSSNKELNEEENND